MSTHAGVATDDSPSTIGIVQFWDSNVPDAIAPLLESVRSLNTDFPYQVFDDESAATFIGQEFGHEMRVLFENCAIPAMRSDLFRYFWLVRHGGLYIDADYRALTNVAPMLTSGRRAHLLLREKGIANGMMQASSPEDPLMLAILDRALQNISAQKSNNVWSVTGPGVLQALHANEANHALFDNVELVPEADFYHFFQAVPHLEYKLRDNHWLNARRLGIKLYRDAPD